jgi:hypothetical protein
MGVHGSSKEFKAFQKKMAEEDLVASPLQMKVCLSGGRGFLFQPSSNPLSKSTPRIVSLFQLNEALALLIL